VKEGESVICNETELARVVVGVRVECCDAEGEKFAVGDEPKDMETELLRDREGEAVRDATAEPEKVVERDAEGDREEAGDILGDMDCLLLVEYDELFDVL